MLESFEARSDRAQWPQSFEELLERSRSLSPEERASRRSFTHAQSADEMRRKNLEHQRDLFRKLSELDEKYQDCTLENFEPRTPGQREALAAAWRVVDDPQHIGLAVTGIWGQAKSILVASLVNTCSDRLIPSVFLTWVNFLDILRDTYDTDGRTRKGRQDLIQRYNAAHVMVIDDIDKEPLTVDVARYLFRVLDARDKAKRPLVITANHCLSDLANAWKFGVGVNKKESIPENETSGAIYRRVKELCGTWIHLEPHRGQV